MNPIESRDRMRELLTPAADCPPLERLIDALFAAEATAEQRQLLEHAAGCASCAAEIELAGGFDAEPRSEAEAVEMAEVSRLLEARRGAAAPVSQGARILPMRERRIPASRVAPRWSRWAAAAMIVLGIGLALRLGGPDAPPALPGGSSSGIVRGSDLVLVAPVGELAGQPDRFVWQAVPSATRYRVELRDVVGDPLWSGEATGTELALPQEARPRIESMVSYQWTVIAYDGEERVVARATPATFRFRP
ncbi:MAG: hypothetical protein AB7G12_02470 [Thermoanaerobaculia bacterium]